MHSRVVVLLGVPLRSDVAEALLTAGYTPLERDGMQRTMATLRKEPVAGVLVGMRTCELDILELLLNIGDVAPNVPVGLIAGHTPFEAPLPMLEDFSNVVLLSESLPAEKQVEGLCRLVESRRETRQPSEGNV